MIDGVLKVIGLSASITCSLLCPRTSLGSMLCFTQDRQIYQMLHIPSQVQSCWAHNSYEHRKLQGLRKIRPLLEMADWFLPGTLAYPCENS